MSKEGRNLGFVIVDNLDENWHPEHPKPDISKWFERYFPSLNKENLRYLDWPRNPESLNPKKV